MGESLVRKDDLSGDLDGFDDVRADEVYFLQEGDSWIVSATGPGDSWRPYKDWDHATTRLHLRDKVTVQESEPALERAETNSKPLVKVLVMGREYTGKSSIGGQIMCMTGHKTFQEILDCIKETIGYYGISEPYLPSLMDPYKKERGGTTLVGRFEFETTRTSVTMMDGPGAREHLDQMVHASIEADAVVLVVSAVKGEFETGFTTDEGTLEHAELAFSLGVSKIIVVVNQLDDVTERESRYNEIVQKLEGCLQNIGFEGVVFLPLSALYGMNIVKGVGDEFGWWRGPSLFEAIDTIEPQPRALGNPILVDRLIARITINKRSERVVTAEYPAFLCTHRAIVGCEISEIRKIREDPSAAHLKKTTALERFASVPFFGRFALTDEDYIGVLGVGEVLGIPEWRGWWNFHIRREFPANVVQPWGFTYCPSEPLRWEL
ncbi:hypothetical protein IGI04_010579 [Brassica rapa subsp. trilocularis]|uniref:Tr-type G domain-containing protein n=1 Tax=Brassica rapa subsp. trilocularis TaxID=1813537 RepID=A0ABQ7N0L0_BRACM|nr:hypothetical protein IGI04_010543 [Brassica rapa subsp. trilocularis]KAG5404457.1 hypothetical protein IGI04_010576 [Brassica rapa subsp. trilocularis]KAG5404460.1 hypothetical protein IGI04_010579 [Brassica rapa subsp. trilocularis]